MTKEEQISTFNPNGPGAKGQLFGLPFTPETSELARAASTATASVVEELSAEAEALDAARLDLAAADASSADAAGRLA